MPGDRVTVETVPDRATADLLCEVLRDGGVTSVDVQTAPGNPYLGRTHTLDYQVRVDDVDEVRARLVLSDFEADSGQAATAQADPPTAAADESPPPPLLRHRKPWVLWGLGLLLLATFGPIALAILRRIFYELFQRS